MSCVLSLGRTIAYLTMLAAAVVSSCAAIAADGFSNSSQGARWGKDYLPNVKVQDQNGKTFRFYDDLIKDKLVVINFIYTSCTDICPLTTARLAQVQEKLGDIIGRDIFMYSITIDPENDTPAALKRHADAFHVGPGWQFLTGKPKDIAAIRNKLGERSRALSEHRHEILLGNAMTGEWSRDSAFGDLERVAFNIRSLDSKWRDVARPSAAGAADATEILLSNNPGEALFTKACAGCHTVGKGDRVGPDLLGVSSRRERAWLARFIATPDKLRAEHDPIALALMAKYTGVRMPNLQLSEADAGDLIIFLEMQSYAVSLGNSAAAHQHDHLGHDHHGQH